MPETGSLHCFPGLNDYSTFLGNRFGLAQFQLPDVFYSQLPGLRELRPAVDSDAWLIADGELLSRDDGEEARLRPTLDLRSGAWLKGGRRRFLGRVCSVALMAIIASGSQGATDISQLELRVYVSEKQLSNIRIGQKVTVKVDTENSMKPYQGSISWISSQAEFSPKVIQTKEERVHLGYAVKVTVKNDGYLNIGMPAEMWLKQ